MGLVSGKSLASLAEGGGSSGLTSTQVQTLIKSNTPYQHVATLTADSSSEFDYTSLPSTFRTFYIKFDGLGFSSQTYLRMRLYFDSTLYTGYLYFHGGMNKDTTSTSNFHGQGGEWDFTKNYPAGSNSNMTGYIEFTGNDNATRATMNSFLTWYNSSSVRSTLSGGHVNANETAYITGFKLFPTSGTMTRGRIKIYGVN